MYYPNLKTTDAEIRALRHLDSRVQSKITPIFELTRSRKTPSLANGSLTKRADQIKEVFGERNAIIDLCTEQQLMNEETVDLFDETGGYEKWKRFVLDNFPPPYLPCALYIDGGTEANFRSQIRWISKEYKKVCLRLSVTDELFPVLYNWCLEEIDPKNVIVCPILYYIEPTEVNRVKDECIHFINAVIGNRPPSVISFSGSSFPRLVTNLPGCGDQFGAFPLTELNLENDLKRQFPNANIRSGDFASVHPRRYETTGGTWVPRIDYRQGMEFRYSRMRRDDGGYRAAAALIPQASVDRLPICWGSDQIKLARDGGAIGASPSFWISARINTWISERVL